MLSKTRSATRRRTAGHKVLPAYREPSPRTKDPGAQKRKTPAPHRGARRLPGEPENQQGKLRSTGKRPRWRNARPRVRRTTARPARVRARHHGEAGHEGEWRWIWQCPGRSSCPPIRVPGKTRDGRCPRRRGRHGSTVHPPKHAKDRGRHPSWLTATPG